jgi:uncharacterized membrane protein
MIGAAFMLGTAFGLGMFMFIDAFIERTARPAPIKRK